MNAKRRIDQIKNLLTQVGLEAERVRMYPISSAMAGEFAQAATEMTEHITKIGINPLRQVEEPGRRGRTS